MKSVTFYETHIPLKIDSLMYSTNSVIVWLCFCFFFYWCDVFVTQEMTLGDDT